MGETLDVDQVKLWVFPEGTRNRDKTVPLLPFKKGAFHVAHNCGLPIVPLGTAPFRTPLNSSLSISVISKHKFLDEPRRTFVAGRGHINVLEMVRPEGKTVDQLMQETRRVMLECLAS